MGGTEASYNPPQTTCIVYLTLSCGAGPKGGGMGYKIHTPGSAKFATISRTKLQGITCNFMVSQVYYSTKEISSKSNMSAKSEGLQILPEALITLGVAIQERTTGTQKHMLHFATPNSRLRRPRPSDASR